MILSKTLKMLFSKALVISSFALLLVACEYIPFSGGELQGKLTPTPADWGTTATVDVIELETNATDPYSVKLWVIAIDRSLYVHAGANKTTWVENIEQDTDVRLLVNELLYELRAERVTGAAEFAQFSDRYEIKYGRRPRNENVGEVYLYRLGPRL